MTPHTVGSQKDFFISYSSADRLWAEWIAWQLKNAGYSIELPARKLNKVSRPNIVDDVSNSATNAKNVIIVVSPDYINTRFTHYEWKTTLKHKLSYAEHSIFPVQVRECDPPLEERQPVLNVINLVGKDEATAKTMLLEGIQHAHNKSRFFEAFILPPVWNIPYAQNAFFTDRENVLHQLHETFRIGRDTASPLPLALSGLEGIGKTQVAIEYAYRYNDEYECVLWAQANSYEGLESSFVEIAKLLHLPDVDYNHSYHIVAATKKWLQENANWLLILDDFTEMSLINSFIPPGCKGDILLTTHVQNMGMLAQPIEVDKMTLEDSALFLLRRVKKKADLQFDQVSLDERNVALEIARLMEGLPLALDQAGTYIEEKGSTLASYLLLYKHYRLKQLKRRGRKTGEHPYSVAFTWSLSFEQVKKADPVAATLLCLCSFLYHEAIPEEIILQDTPNEKDSLGPASTDQLMLDKAVKELRRFSFIRRDAIHKLLSVHSLVQVVLKETLTKATQKQWAERTIRAVNRVFPKVTFSTWERCRRYMPHVEVCAAFIEQWQITTPEAGQLLHEAASYLHERTMYKSAEHFYKRALHIRETLYGKDHPDVATTLNDLAWLYRTNGRYSEAESHFQRALTIRENAFGPEHPDVATTLNDLAWLYYNLGHYQHAEQLHLRALDIRKKTQPPDNLATATSLNNLAWLYYKKGQYGQAEQLYLQTLNMRMTNLGEDHPYTATSLNNLALLYFDQARDKEAEQFYNKALAIRQQSLELDHPDTATSMNGLAQLYYAQGHYAQAEVLYEKALHIWQQVFWSDHSHVALVLNNLARLYRAQGRYGRAEEYYDQALAIRERVLSPEHPDVAQTLHHRARLYRSQGKYKAALEDYLRALAIREEVLGANHPDVAATMNNLARLYRVLGNYTQAENLHLQALALREKALGFEHPDVAQTLNNLARLYLKQGRYADAASRGRQAWVIWKNTLGEKHHYLALILNNLGEIAYAQGNYRRAETLYIAALTLQERASDVDNHPHVSLILNNLAEICLKRERYSEAEAYVRRAIAIREQILGSEHPYIAFSLTILADIYRIQGNFSEAEEYLTRSIRLREHALGPEHPDRAISMAALANLYAIHGQSEKAEVLYQQALTLQELSLGVEHPNAIAARENYTLFLKERGKDVSTALSRKHEQTSEELVSQAESICQEENYS